MNHDKYGSLRKHYEKYSKIMNEVKPIYLTPTITFEKRSNRLPYEIINPEK